MDMSAGDFMALFYLLKVPVELLNLKVTLLMLSIDSNLGTIDMNYRKNPRKWPLCT